MFGIVNSQLQSDATWPAAPTYVAQRLAAMRAKYQAWDETLPKHPDATYSVPATKADMATPSS